MLKVPILTAMQISLAIGLLIASFAFPRSDYALPC
jgi:hypothetical protein